MAAYPSIIYTNRSRRTVIPNTKTDFTAGGLALTRSVGPIQFAFEIDHALITSTERGTLDAFLENNKIITFTFSWEDGETYDVKFTDAGIQTGHMRGPFYWGKSIFRGTKQ